jgi:hypothetical protein
MTSKAWMPPPSVYDVIRPNIHNTIKIRPVTHNKLIILSSCLHGKNEHISFNRKCFSLVARMVLHYAFSPIGFFLENVIIPLLFLKNKFCLFKYLLHFLYIDNSSGCNP